MSGKSLDMPFVLASHKVASESEGWEESEGILHHRTDFEPQVVRHGESVQFVSYWSRQSQEITRPGDYRVALHLTRVAGRDPLYLPAVGKPYRRIQQLATGEARDLEHFHVPVDGLLSPDRWPEDRVVRDEYELFIPANLKPGSYQVRIRMKRVPIHYNSIVSQLFSDDSPEDGPVVGTLTVAARDRGGS